MKEYIARLQSLMTIILIGSLVALLVPKEGERVIELALMAQNDARQVIGVAASLGATLPRDATIQPPLDTLVAVASRLMQADARVITFRVILEAQRAVDALEPWDEQYPDLKIARWNLGKRVVGLGRYFVKAKLVSSVDVVQAVDKVLNSSVPVPFLQISVERDQAAGLFAIALVVMWLYAASTLITLRRMILEGFLTKEDLWVLRSWIGFQPWPLGPVGAIAWLVVLPVSACANVLFEDVPVAVWFGLGLAVLMVALLRTRRALGAAIRTASTASAGKKARPRPCRPSKLRRW